MSIVSAIATRNALLTTIGKSALNIRYPDEFELYIIALELTDSNFNTLKYFIFPINPSMIDENKVKTTNVKKTLAGVTTLSTTTFIPTDINLNGNFGRSFKVLLGSEYMDFRYSFSTIFNKGLDGQLFDARVKTGYGCIKILENIIETADNVDEDGKSYNLIFHNPALGNSYLVKPMGLKFSMSEGENNMVWNYSLQLKSIAPLKSIFQKMVTENASKQLVVTNYAQKKVNQLLNTVSSALGSSIYNAPNFNP